MSAEFRVGRSVGRTIYQGDDLVGLMDTVELAERAVAAMNRAEALIDPNDQEIRKLIYAAVYQHQTGVKGTVIAHAVFDALRSAAP